MNMAKSLRYMSLINLKGLFRNKIALLFNIILPVALMLLFGSIYAEDSSAKLVVGLVDNDRGAVAQSVRQSLNRTFDVTAGEESALREQLSKGKVKAVLLLPEGLSNAVEARRAPGVVTILYDPTSTTSGEAQGRLQEAIAILDTAMRGTPPLIVASPQALETKQKLNVFDFLMPGQLAYMLLSAGLVSVAMSLAQQRQTGALRHMFSTPLSVPVWIAARMIAALLMALIQITVLYGIGMAAFKLTLPSDLLGTMVLLMLSALASLGMGLAIGATAKNAEAAMPVSMIFFISQAFLGGSMTPLDSMPQIVHTLAKFMPSHYMTHGLKLVMMQGKGLGDVWIDLTVLTGVTVLTVALAAWRMRKQFVAA